MDLEDLLPNVQATDIFWLTVCVSENCNGRPPSAVIPGIATLRADVNPFDAMLPLRNLPRLSLP